MRALSALALLACATLAVAGCLQVGPPATDTGSATSGGQVLGGAGAGASSPVSGAGQPGGPPPQPGQPGASAPPSGTGAPASGPGGAGPSGAPSGGSTSSSSSGSTGVGWDVPQSVHQAAWLCQAAITVNDITPAGTDGQQCRVTLTFSSTTLTVASTGIPNHNFESGSGCCATTQSFTNTFPLHPTLATSATYPSKRGSIATAVNGVAIFGPEDSQGADVVIATYSNPTTQPRLALCDAHSEPQSGVYHYHADGNCMHWHPGTGQQFSDYSFSKVDSSTHSKIIGFAPDGFPIYGTYGYAADNVTIKEMTSSYRLKAGATGSNGQDDQEYVAGMGDLDECNGKVGPTPEFPNGIYHYYSTKHNGEGGYGFPYFPLCYKGVVTSSGTGMRSGGSSSGTPPGGGSGSSGSGSMSGSQTGGPPPSGGGGGGGTSCPPPPTQGQPPPSSPPPSGCPPPPH